MALPRTLARRLSANVGFLVAESGVTNLVSFAVSFLIARAYDPDTLGRVGILLAVLAIGVLLSDLGSGQASTLLISRRLAGLSADPPGRVAAAGILQNAVGGVLLAGLILFLPDIVIALTSAAGMADRAAQVAELATPLRLVAVWVLAATLMQQTAGVFAGLQRTQYTLLQSLVAHGPRLAVTAGVALAARPWEWIAWGWTGSYAVAGAVAIGLWAWVLRRGRYPLTLEGYRPAARLRLGAALWTPLAAGFILQYLAIGVIWWMSAADASYTNVGLFAPLWTLSRGYEVLLMPLAVALLPAVSDAHGTRDPRAVEHLVRRSLTVTALAAVAVMAMFVVVPRLLLGLFGAAYVSLAVPLVVLAYAVAFEAQRCALDPLLNGSGQARWVTALDWSKFALLLALAIPLYAAQGLHGIAWAFVGAFIPAWAAKLALVRAKLKVRVLAPAALLAALLTAALVAGLYLQSSG